ncbi:MAG: hypothetical protein ABSF83_05845 [Nitrososphaerales archaeon]|jgi:hypothetical protein
MEEPKGKRPSRRVLMAAVLVLVVAGAGYLIYSYANPAVRCEFVPGNSLYVHVVTADPNNPVSSLGVKGWLYEACPIGSPGNAASRPTSTILGNWDFVTNSTGWVSIPSADLAGWSFTFNVPYEGHIYQFMTPVCGGGTATLELNLPSGRFNETGHGPGESVSDLGGGVQRVESCNVGVLSGNATIS